MEDWKEYQKKFDANMSKLVADDKAAKEAGTLVGRYISEPAADGHAYYRITREGKSTVVVNVVTEIGDDWRVPYWGDRASVKKAYVLEALARRDARDRIFA